jgi:hypothetical protein
MRPVGDSSKDAFGRMAGFPDPPSIDTSLPSIYIIQLPHVDGNGSRVIPIIFVLESQNMSVILIVKASIAGLVRGIPLHPLINTKTIIKKSRLKYLK